MHEEQKNPYQAPSEQPEPPLRAQPLPIIQVPPFVRFSILGGLLLFMLILWLLKL